MYDADYHTESNQNKPAYFLPEVRIPSCQTEHERSIQNAIRRTSADECSLCSLCDADAELVETIWNANKDGMSNCSLCGYTVSIERGGRPLQRDWECSGPCDELHLTSCECSEAYLFKLKQKVDRLTDCEAHVREVRETAVKLAYEEPCLPHGEAMNVVHCLLLGLWHMSMHDNTKSVFIQYGAPVIFIDCFWKLFDICIKDETNSKVSVSKRNSLISV